MPRRTLYTENLRLLNNLQINLTMNSIVLAAMQTKGIEAGLTIEGILLAVIAILIVAAFTK